MTLREVAGQLLIMGFDGTELTAELKSMLKEIQPGGVVLFARNIVEAKQTWKLLMECQKCVRTPLLCCVDLEGGTVDRFRNVIAPTPSAQAVFESKTPQLFRLHGKVIGQELHALGFNVDFAPACDLALPEAKKVLTSRVVSADPTEVSSYVREFLKGLREACVLGCGKHFPGLGGGSLDTHKKIAPINRSLKELWGEDIVPYRELSRKMPFVMVSHAAYSKVTKQTPASLSKKCISDILRKKVGYTGVVVSDDLEMGAAIVGAGAMKKRGALEPTAAELVGLASLTTLKAGADMYLVSHQADMVMTSFERVLREAERSERFAAQISESAKRVLTLKRRFAIGEQRPPAPSQKVVDKLRRSIWEFEEELRLAKVAMQETSN